MKHSQKSRIIVLGQRRGMEKENIFQIRSIIFRKANDGPSQKIMGLIWISKTKKGGKEKKERYSCIPRKIGENLFPLRARRKGKKRGGRPFGLKKGNSEQSGADHGCPILG